MKKNHSAQTVRSPALQQSMLGAGSLRNITEQTLIRNLRAVGRVTEESLALLAGKSGGTTAAKGPPYPGATTNVFQRCGQAWYTRFAMRVACFNHTSGIWHVHFLLETYMRQRGVPVNVDEMCRHQGEEVTPGVVDPVVDEATKKDCVKRVKKIEEELIDAKKCGDGEETTRLEGEREEMFEYLRKTVGKRGKPRLTTDGDRRRKKVWAALSEAFAIISKHNAELGNHLDQYIDTGFECFYLPREHMEWEL